MTKIYKDMFGNGSKIDGDSIHLETGSNANGSWVKHPSGWMECVRVVRPVRNSKVNQKFDFPQSFVSPPFASYSDTVSAYEPFIVGSTTMFLATTADRWEIQFTNTASGVNDVPLMLRAFGRYEL